MTADPTALQAERLKRLKEFRTTMRTAGLTADAIASPENIYYLFGLDHGGHFSFTLALVPVDGEPVLFTREMERAPVAAQVTGCRHAVFRDGEDPADRVASELRTMTKPGDRVGLEEQAMFFPPAIASRIRELTLDRRWTDTSNLLSDQRTVKSQAELDTVRQAADLSGLAMRTAIETIRPGAVDRQVASAALKTMLDAGGQLPGFVPLVRPLSLLSHEHVTWTDSPLCTGEGAFVELSGCVSRYHAPMSRTIHLGHAPEGAAEAHAAAYAGWAAAVDALRPGTLTKTVYHHWHTAVEEALGKTHVPRHHCGYLVGIGFQPSWVGGGEVLGIRPDGDTEIRAGMTFHLMSWVTEPVGHVISDTVLVTDGDAEPLTHAPRDLIVLP